MSFGTILSQTSKMLNTVSEYTVMTAAAAMALVILLQVFSRYVLNNSLFWSEELGRMLLVWCSFVGASVAYRRGAHMGIALLVDRLPHRGRLAAACVAHLAAGTLFWVMLWHGWQFFQLLEPQRTVSLGFSRQWPFLAVPLSGGVMLMHAAWFLYRDFQDLLRGEEPQ